MSTKGRFFILSLIVTLFFTVSCTRNIESLALLPQPVKVEAENGFFTIDTSMVIVSNNVFCAEYLRTFMVNAPGMIGDNSIESVIISTDDDDVWDMYEKRKGAVILKIDNDFDVDGYVCAEGETNEAYSLDISKRCVEIEAGSQSGLFYGIQTFLQLLPEDVYKKEKHSGENWKIGCIEIEDYPAYNWRGWSFDVSRQFFPKEFIYSLIDWMSYHKMNRFHWHLTDDNGWRVEIKSHPLLTEKGAWRGPGEVLPEAYGSGKKRYGGFYTQDEIRDIIKYASDRGVEIIPEIDMPGHSKALVSVYPWAGCKNTSEFVSVNGETKNILCVSDEAIYKVIDDIIGELASLFPGKYIHIGGDEVQFKNWEECPHCQAFMKERNMENERELQRYFVQKMNEIVSSHGKIMCGWSEIADVDIERNKGKELQDAVRTFSDDTHLWAWKENSNCIEFLRCGYPTIFQIAQYSYFDMKQSDLERGHNWAGNVPLEKAYSLNPEKMVDSISVAVYGRAASEAEKANIAGVQCGLWCELLNKPARFAEYQFFPRTVAFAQTGWCGNRKESFDIFKRKLDSKHFERLANMGIAFRVEPPVVYFNNGTFRGESNYTIRYTSDRTSPTSESPILDSLNNIDKPGMYRFAAFFNDSIHSIAVLAKDIAPAEYLTPETKIETSFNGEYKGFPQSNITDYDFNTYWRTDRMAKKGDYVSYIFSEPVVCSRIVVESAIPNIDFYGVTDGHLEYTIDGKEWKKGENFVENISIIENEDVTKGIKGVKIVFDDSNDALCMCFQDIRLEK